MMVNESFNNDKEGFAMNNVIMIALAIFLPPISVLIKEGVGKHLIINILLCLLGLLPGIIHAVWINVRNN
jgi:uncharacterized membrane protein YqaE (UPF0057 family)